MSDQMKKTHNVVAVTGKYTDNSGQERNRYVTIGAAFTREDGSMAIKLESLPVGPGWNGWANLYLPRDKDQQATTPPAKATPTREPGSDDGFGDKPSDIPVGDVPFGD